MQSVPPVLTVRPSGHLGVGDHLMTMRSVPQVKRLATAALEGAESDKMKAESLTHLARAHHATQELEAAFSYYRQV